MFTRVVKFKDGRYGLRKLTLSGYKYRDLRGANHWWSVTSTYMRDCKGKLSDVITELDRGKALSKKDVAQARLVDAIKGEN